MAQTNSLVVGYDSFPTLEQFPCLAGYHAYGLLRNPFGSGGILAGQQIYLNAGHGKIAPGLYAKVAYGGNWILEAYDIATGAYQSQLSSSAGPGNILIDRLGNLVSYDVGLNISKYPVSGGSGPAIWIDKANNPFWYGGFVLHWSPTSDLCILSNINYIDGGQTIGHFNAATGQYSGLLLSRSQFFDSAASSPDPAAVQKIYFSDFGFGADHQLYCADAGLGRVARFNGATGDFIDEFIPSVALPGPIQQLLFSPDGTFLYLIGGSHIAVYDAAGALQNSFACSYPNPGYATFVSQTLNPRPLPFRIPGLAFLTQILNGVIGDNRGFVIPPGRGPQPSPGWPGAAEQIWSNLDSRDREGLVGTGIMQLSGLLENAELSQELLRVLESRLDRKTLDLWISVLNQLERQ